MSPTNKRSSTIPLLFLVIALFLAIVTILISLQVVSSKQLRTSIPGSGTNPGSWPNPIGQPCCQSIDFQSDITGNAVGVDQGSFFGPGTQAQAQADAFAIAAPQMAATCGDPDWLRGALEMNPTCGELNNGMCEAAGSPSSALGASSPGICNFTQITTGWFASPGWEADCSFVAMCNIKLACSEKSQPAIVDLSPDPECMNPTTKTGYATSSSYMNFSETEDNVGGRLGGLQPWQLFIDLEYRTIDAAKDYFDERCSVYSPSIDCHPNCDKTQYTSGGVSDGLNYFYIDTRVITPPFGRMPYAQADLHCAFAFCSAQQECELKEDPDDGDTSSDTTGAETDTGSGSDGMYDGMEDPMDYGYY